MFVISITVLYVFGDILLHGVLNDSGVYGVYFIVESIVNVIVLK
jgi:hypothetical protein